MIKVNCSPHIHIEEVGNESIPILVIDDFFHDVDDLIETAGDGSEFKSNPNDYYPGSRKPISEKLGIQVCDLYWPLLKKYFPKRTQQYQNLLSQLSTFSLTTTNQEALRPIQTLPHIDTFDIQQFAVVHYLFDSNQGGTSFYRHIETGFETINEQRISAYGTLLKQQAMKAQLHKKLKYMDGDNELFTRIHSINAKKNRAIIYPSNLLHSGNILQKESLSFNPQKGRLTANYFLKAI